MPDYIPDDLIGGHCQIVASLFQSMVLIFVVDVDKMWRSDLSWGCLENCFREILASSGSRR